jgi:hypothetical protein
MSYHFLDWKYLNEEQIGLLESSLEEIKIKELLKEYFNINYADEKKNVIATDYHFYNYAFCKERAFDARRTSTFMAIMNEIFHRDSLTTGLVKSRQSSYKFFEELVLKHSVELPPESIQVFKDVDVNAIMDYAVESYYKQFNLFSYIFSIQERIITVEKPLPSVNSKKYPLF